MKVINKIYSILKFKSFKKRVLKPFGKILKKLKSKKNKTVFLNFLKKAVIYLITSYAFFLKAAFILVLCIKFINPPFSSLMIYRGVKNNYKIKNRVFIPIKHIKRSMKNALIIAEDKKFYSHYGIDLEAIKTAYEVNQRLKRKQLGGSTITQQTVRTIFLFPDKNYFRKIIEIHIALIADLILSKERILELYFNYVEFGRGVFGVVIASYYHYGKSFYKLDTDEMIRLITILPSPIRYSPNNFYKNERLLERYNFIKTVIG